MSKTFSLFLQEETRLLATSTPNSNEGFALIVPEGNNCQNMKYLVYNFLAQGKLRNGDTLKWKNSTRNSY